MLSSDLVTGQLLNIGLGYVTQGNHADSLPDTESDTRGDTTVQTLHTALAVDVLGSVADSHLLGAVGILLLALHLHADDLNRLVPGRETTTESRGENLLGSAELLAVLLVGNLADTLLGQTGETEAGTPVGHLSNGDGIDTLVDSLDTLLAVDIHKGSKGALRLDTRSSELVLCDLDRLHAGTETHGGVSLSNTTDNTTNDTTTKLGGTSVAGIVFGFGSDEEEYSALGGRLDPSPGNETLVDCIGKITCQPLATYSRREERVRRANESKELTYTRRHHRDSKCGPGPW
jgi:hypothetical protein